MPQRRLQFRREAFSLVEVVLALGVVAFAIVSVFGLVPAGLTNFRRAMDTSAATVIFQKVLEDVRQSDFSQLAQPGNTSPEQVTVASASYSAALLTRYFDEGGNELLPSPTAPAGQTGWNALAPADQSRAVYWVNTRIAAALLPENQSAQSSASASLPNSILQHYALAVTVQIVRNPAGLSLELGDDNLVAKGTRGIGPIQTRSAVIAKND